MATQTGSLKKISLAELAKHNHEDSAWVAINSKVYDVTDFLESHPGGRRILMTVLGKDCTQQFAQFHNTVTVLGSYGPKLVIGELDGAEKLPPKEDGKLYGELVPYGDPSWYQGWYTPYYNQSHKDLRDYVRGVVAETLTPFALEWENAKMFPLSVYKHWGQLGLLVPFMGAKKWPSEYAPCGPPCGIKPEDWDVFHELIVTDELARCASTGISAGLNTGPMIALPAIYNFGNDEMKQKVLIPCLAGLKTSCLAISEPYAGSDVAGMVTNGVLTPDGKHFIVNGEKKWITNGVWADFFITGVRTGNAGGNGLSMLLLERGMPGLKTRAVSAQGNIGSGTAYVMMENVKVPVSNIIGKEGEGFKQIMKNFNHERLGICWGVVRQARVCFEEAMKYANRRKTFGQFLIEHGVIRNKFGHMARLIEATQAWTESVTYNWGKLSHDDADRLLGGPIALLKAQCSLTFELCAREASQIMGGIAYTKGGQGEKVERLYRDVRGAAIPGGSEEIMLDFGVRQQLKVMRGMGAKI
ncbi:hypothetical protein SmJEL517_g05812 [Synchytrium microbalum]|uniref:Cytochrome b5 heme-binding domain-containing protein n=1 Tax=Synchytrium microbalum TaxID=1806994 RepID=A0A507BZ97_9FUNG|nr:uncharacterized protein SmJEL517_g05812 [Synchytrium microbalum]TPX30675.1 hypothetical protein SmJEL517_g05812 [Synchytrium microbalum]